MILKLDNMESDLVLACKRYYGNNGVEKVIGNYCAYSPENCEMDSKYYFISELLMKLIGNGNLRLEHLLSELSPRHINGLGQMDKTLDAETKVYNRMESMIRGLQVKEQDKDGNYYDLVELGELNEKFVEKEEKVFNVLKWDSMIIEEQEKYIVDNNVKIKYSTNIADVLTRGFGNLDDNGFWEYQCKKNGE